MANWHRDKVTNSKWDMEEINHIIQSLILQIGNVKRKVCMWSGCSDYVGTLVSLKNKQKYYKNMLSFLSQVWDMGLLQIVQHNSL